MYEDARSSQERTYANEVWFIMFQELEEKGGF
jgi:hypothetical protein